MSTKLTGQLDSVQQNVDNWLNMLAWLLTVLFVWLAFTQVGLFMQGWEMVVSERKVVTEVIEAAPSENIAVDTHLDD